MRKTGKFKSRFSVQFSDQIPRSNQGKSIDCDMALELYTCRSMLANDRFGKDIGQK
jgi:hypothetical protein